MTSFMCRKCGASVKMHPHTRHTIQCRGCKQWHEVDRNNTVIVTALDSFYDMRSVPDQIRKMKDKIVEYLDTKSHDMIIFGPGDIYITPAGCKRNPDKSNPQLALSAWMDTWRGDANWRTDGYIIKRYNDSKPFKYIAVRE